VRVGVALWPEVRPRAASARSLLPPPARPFPLRAEPHCRRLSRASSRPGLSGSGGAPVAGGGTGLDSAVTDGVRKRCPMVGGVQQVLRNAFCWCANAAGTGFATGNQGAIKGVMWQKPSTAGAAVGTAAVPCDEANPNSCIQAECQVTKEGNNWCDNVELRVLCGPPY
jgi:hypothetical protein